MRFVLAILALGGFVAPAVAQQVDTAIYSYAHTDNFCPAGLQPVVAGPDGISCGQPNQTVTYQTASTCPGKKRHHHRVNDCPPGVKGCS